MRPVGHRENRGGEVATPSFTDQFNGATLSAHHGYLVEYARDKDERLAFHVDDLEEVVARVEAEGWWYRRSRPELQSKYIFVKDPSGYDIEILQASVD